MNGTLPLILLSVVINTAAQLFLKAGMMRIGHFEFTWANFMPIASKVALNPYIFLGMLSYMASIGVWLMVLSRVNVSYAYPMVSLGYILTCLAGYFFLHEPVTLIRVAGIFVIILGVIMITRS